MAEAKGQGRLVPGWQVLPEGSLGYRGDFGDGDLARFFVEKYEVRKSSTRINGHAILRHRVLAVPLFFCGFNEVSPSLDSVFLNEGYCR